MDGIFVDLPNHYSRLFNLKTDEKLLRDYFLYWFDFDRLAQYLTGENFSSTWVFHSKRRIGPSNGRIEDRYLNNFIDRINRLPGVTTRDVDIPGDQNERTNYKCPDCGKEGDASWETEKGVDSSLTVHMIDTMDAWDVAYLLSGDADFVPVVSYLRRKGKIVIGAGCGQAAPALIRECFDYHDLKSFFSDDIFLYEISKSIIETWLTAELTPVVSSNNASVSFMHEKPTAGDLMRETHNRDSRLYRISFTFSANSRLDWTLRQQLMDELANRYPMAFTESMSQSYVFSVNKYAWKGFERRLNEIAILGNIVPLTHHFQTWYTLKYECFNEVEGYMQVE